MWNQAFFSLPSEATADDIGLVGRVDPRLLSGTDPVYDHYSFASISNFASEAKVRAHPSIYCSNVKYNFCFPYTHCSSGEMLKYVHNYAYRKRGGGGGIVYLPRKSLLIPPCLPPHQNRYWSCQLEEWEGTVGGGPMITSCLALYQNRYWSCQLEDQVRRDSRRWACDHFLSSSLPESLLLLSGGRGMRGDSRKT